MPGEEDQRPRPITKLGIPTYKIYYHKLRDVWPEDVVEDFDRGRFDNPDPPYYYQSAESDRE